MKIESKYLDKFNELRQFFLQNGHCYVPSTLQYADLFEWTQRIKQSRLNLSAAFIKELESMGFDWIMYSSIDLQWQSWYYELKLFKIKNGHCRVPFGQKNETGLGKWVSRQRNQETKLPAYRKKLLVEIGFSWKADMKRLKEEKWLSLYEQLIYFKKENGHLQIPNDSENATLYNWIKAQRSAENNLPQTRKNLLDEIGFLWKLDLERLKEEKWNQLYKALIEFKKEKGHCRVPSTYKKNQSLAYWVYYHREREEKVSAKHKEQLDKIGFCWNKDMQEFKKQRWQQQFEALVLFKKQYGHCRVPGGWKDNPPLANWVSTQRQNEDIVSIAHKKLLDELGFFWSKDMAEYRAAKWRKHYDALLAFREKYGHCRVSNASSSAYLELRYWVRFQRQEEKTMSKTRKDLLDAIGFSWISGIKKLKVDNWQAKFEALLLFKKQHSHCRVPSTDANQKLAKWVSHQRKLGDKMQEYRKKCLDEIGFAWKEDMEKYKEQKWEWQYQELVKFKQEHGHCKPSEKNAINSLVLWVARHRGQKERISPERIVKLDAIGFSWKVDIIQEQEDIWQKRKEELVAFKAKHGHCRVSKSCPNKKLLHWVTYYRQYKYRVSSDKVKLLDAIGFAWSENIQKEKEDKWLKHYEALKAYYQEHGHCKVPHHYPPNLALGTWVRIQCDKRDSIRIDRKRLLDEINFHWGKYKAKENREKFNKRYKRLKTYFEKYGHTQVPANWKEDKELATWVVYLRAYKKRLTTSQYNRLKAIDFKWKEDVLKERDEKWMKQYRQIIAFKRKQGHFRLTIGQAGLDLVRWATTQRKYQFTMIEWRKNLLSNIGFPWSTLVFKKEQWKDRYQQLVAFQERFGHANVPDRWEEDKTLARWVRTIRDKKDKLNQLQIEQLEAINFLWKEDLYKNLETPWKISVKNDLVWEEHYQQLTAFYLKNGHARVKSTDVNQELAVWVSRQRKRYEEGKLSPERIRLLNKLDFIWDGWKFKREKIQQEWLENYKKLIKYKKQYGHFKVKQKPPFGSLSKWINRQNTAFNAGLLKPERQQLLEKIGFEWTNTDTKLAKYEKKWQLNFEQLKQFKLKNRHFRIKQAEDKDLYKWVELQRIQNKQGTLKKHRTHQLEKIGFSWDGRAARREALQAKWQLSFEQFQQFVKENGHGWVKRNDPDKKLGAWVATQRGDYRDKIISDERYQLLTKAGFIWEATQQRKLLEEKGIYIRNLTIRRKK